MSSTTVSVYRHSIDSKPSEASSTEARAKNCAAMASTKRHELDGRNARLGMAPGSKIQAPLDCWQRVEFEVQVDVGNRGLESGEVARLQEHDAFVDDNMELRGL